MSKTLKGKCLCGAVHFSATGPFAKTSSCHCSQCARWTGGVFSSTTLDRKNLHISGETSLRWYASSQHARRGFCANCGSSLFWEQPESGKIDILLGTLDPPTGLEIGYHIFVGGKNDYYPIADGKPQYREYINGPQLNGRED